MTHRLEIHGIEPDGRILFSFTGPETGESSPVSIVDRNTGLTVHRTGFTLRNGLVYWISTGGSNAARLRNVALRVEHSTGIHELYATLHGESRHIVVEGKPIKLENSGDDLFPIVCEIFYDRIYERDFVRLDVGDVVVDVGANYGVFGLYAQMFRPSRVVCVEPVRSTYDQMVRNLSGFGVSCVNKAVSWEDGTDTFAITEVNGNNYSKRHGNAKHVEWGLQRAIREEEVETVNVNTLIREQGLERIDFLKVDCEGGELALFSTIDPSFLRDRVSKVALEYHTSAISERVNEILVGAGFTIEDKRGTPEVGQICAYKIRS